MAGQLEVRDRKHALWNGLAVRSLETESMPNNMAGQWGLETESMPIRPLFPWLHVNLRTATHTMNSYSIYQSGIDAFESSLWLTEIVHCPKILLMWSKRGYCSTYGDARMQSTRPLTKKQPQHHDLIKWNSSVMKHICIRWNSPVIKHKLINWNFPVINNYGSSTKWT